MPDVKVLKVLVAHPHQLAASQTIAPGKFVFKNSSGFVEIADASSAALLGVCMQNITSSAEGDEVMVFDDPNEEFEMACDTAGEAIQTVVGEEHDLIVTSTIQLLNLGATATKVLKVLAIAGNFDPLMDGTAITGSALAGNFTPPWNSAARCRVKIDLHQLGNQSRLS